MFLESNHTSSMVAWCQELLAGLKVFIADLVGTLGAQWRGKLWLFRCVPEGGRPSKPSKQLVNQRKKSITESKGLRGEKGEAKIPKIKHSPSGLCFMDHHGHKLENIENKSWRTSVEGDEIRCLTGLAYKNSMTPYSCSCFFLLVVTVLVKRLLSNVQQGEVSNAHHGVFSCIFSPAKMEMFSRFSYLKFTFQGGFVWGWSFSKPRHGTSHHF